MSEALNIGHVHSPVCNHPHGACATNNKSNKILKMLEKVSAVALGIFSAMTDLELFVPFFLIGVGIGAYNAIQGVKKDNHNHPVSACSQGFVEHLVGIRLPESVSLVINLAVTACHIDHHAHVFVPAIALTLGAWMGQSWTTAASLAYRKVEAYFLHIPLEVHVAI